MPSRLYQGETQSSSNQKSKPFHSSGHFSVFVWRGYGKNQAEWTGKSEMSSLEALVVGKACCYAWQYSYSRLTEMESFPPEVFFNFCVRSIPRREPWPYYIACAKIIQRMEVAQRLLQLTQLPCRFEMNWVTEIKLLQQFRPVCPSAGYERQWNYKTLFFGHATVSFSANFFVPKMASDSRLRVLSPEADVHNPALCILVDN